MFSLFTAVAMPLVVNSFFNDMSAVDEAHRPVPHRGSTAIVKHFIFSLSDYLLGERERIIRYKFQVITQNEC